MGIFGWIVVALIVFRLIRKSNRKARAKAEEEERRQRREAEENERRWREAEEEKERKRREAKEKEERRQNTPCYFIDGFSESVFEMMAIRAAKPIRRLTVSVEGPIIYGTVQAQSGISEWYFKADFNDFGHITGRYWLSVDNSDSNIPDKFVDNLQSLIEDYNADDYKNDKADNDSEARSFSGVFCPYCGEKITVSDALFCTHCGRKLT